MPPGSASTKSTIFMRCHGILRSRIRSWPIYSRTIGRNRALDLGCGTGVSSRLLAKVGYQVDAWDVSATAIARARALSVDRPSIIRYFAGNAIRHALGCRNTYDLILDFLLLHHVQDADIAGYFCGIRQSLRAGGHYIVGVFVKTGDTVTRGSYFSDGEVRCWTLSEIRQYLRAKLVCHTASYGQAGSADHIYPFGLFMFASRENDERTWHLGW